MNRTIFVLALALALAGSPALAQPYPNKAVKVLVPFAAGGAVDIMGRTMELAALVMHGDGGWLRPFG